jgi:hypothetical protein
MEGEQVHSKDGETFWANIVPKVSGSWVEENDAFNKYYQPIVNVRRIT